MPALAQIIYRAMLRPVLFRLDAERAHRLAISALSSMPAIRPRRDAPELAIDLFGLHFTNPIGLAAGMDKDARAAHAWQAMGFGFAELGTITPMPQPGNPPPRVWRLPANRAVVNRLGFPSEGAEAVAARIERLRRRGIRIPLALNFGPNKDTPPDRVAADYAVLMRRLGPMADFVVVNVSSPNTPGLRNWQSPLRMRELFAAMNAEIAPGARKPPILIKLAPDLDPPTLHAICDTALALGLDGIVATNTTIRREEVGVSSALEGGLSGAPLLPVARRLIADIHRHTGGRIAIIGVGGIMSAEDAFGHITAGASLVELYTGLVYEGPGLVAAIKAGLGALLRREGFRSISEAVGSAARAV
jgi:dihydroorotate dehydrogenase